MTFKEAQAIIRQRHESDDAELLEQALDIVCAFNFDDVPLLIDSNGDWCDYATELRYYIHNLLTKDMP